MWFIRIWTAPLEARIRELEVETILLTKDNDSLRSRLREFELDDREIRRSLLTRVGLLAAPPKDRDGQAELKPIRKVTPPWNVQAAKLEADSKERYWKKVIEDREALDRRASGIAPKVNGAEKSEAEQIAEDVEEMSR